MINNMFIVINMTIKIYADDKNLFGLEQSEFTEKQILDNEGYIKNSEASKLFGFLSGQVGKNNNEYDILPMPCIERQNSEDYVTHEELFEIIHENASDKLTDTFRYTAHKEKYKLVEKDVFEDFVRVNPINERSYNYDQYAGDEYKCYHYSIDFKGNIQQWDSDLAVGTASNNIHGYNVFVTTENEVYGFEPQNDNINRLQAMTGDMYVPIGLMRW